MPPTVDGSAPPMIPFEALVLIRIPADAPYRVSQRVKWMIGSMKLREPPCAICGDSGTVIDHVIPVRAAPELADLPANLWPLCRMHHAEKTHLERRIYLSRQSPGERESALRNTRRRRDRRRESGLCINCAEPANPADGGFETCAHCRERRQMRIDRRKAVGECGKCGRPVEGDNTACTDCLERRRLNYHPTKEMLSRRAAAAMSRYYRRREAGLCGHCETPALPGLSFCFRHGSEARARARERKEARKDAGLCTQCGRKPARRGYLLCSTHQAEARRRYHARHSPRRSPSADPAGREWTPRRLW